MLTTGLDAGAERLIALHARHILRATSNPDETAAATAFVAACDEPYIEKDSAADADEDDEVEMRAYCMDTVGSGFWCNAGIDKFGHVINGTLMCPGQDGERCFGGTDWAGPGCTCKAL